MDERGVTAERPIRVAALIAMVAVAGCKDSGLPGRNTPLAEAQAAEWSYPVYEAGETRAVMLGDHEWKVAGPPIRIPQNLLVAVEGADHEVFALATDPAPYSRLYLNGADGWTPLARVPVQSGQAEAHQ